MIQLSSHYSFSFLPLSNFELLDIELFFPRCFLCVCLCALGVWTVLLDGPHLHQAAAPPNGAQSPLCTQVQLVLLPASELCLHLRLHRPVQCHGKPIRAEQSSVTLPQCGRTCTTLLLFVLCCLFLRPQVVWMARYLLELSLLEGQCVVFSPMQLAGAALCLARQVLQEPLTAEGEAAWYLASSVYAGR